MDGKTGRSTDRGTDRETWKRERQAEEQRLERLRVEEMVNYLKGLNVRIRQLKVGKK